MYNLKQIRCTKKPCSTKRLCIDLALNVNPTFSTKCRKKVFLCNRSKRFELTVNLPKKCKTNNSDKRQMGWASMQKNTFTINDSIDESSSRGH